MGSGAPLTVIHFPGGMALPLYVALDEGFFQARELDVRLEPTRDSRQLMVGLIEGRYEIGHAALDNVVAYQEGQAPVAFDGEPDLFAFTGVAPTNLALVVQPDVAGYADLRGRSLAVDAPTTGFAFVLRKMLERGGLGQADYRLVAVGGDAARLESLRAGDHAGALLTLDFANLARDHGLAWIGQSLDLLGRYQGTSLIARRSWARANEGAMVAFIRAVLAALDWLFDAANSRPAARILARRIEGLSDAAAEKSLGQLLAPRTGLSRDGALDAQGVRTVLDLRSQYAMPQKPLTDAGRYLDLSYYRQAVV